MKKIQLGGHTKSSAIRGYALVDDDCYEYLNQWNWHMWNGGCTAYAIRNINLGNGKRTAIRMHSLIMNPPKGMGVDHKDGDGLNNQRENLRVCTQAENSRNRQTAKTNKAGLIGVTYLRGKWLAVIHVNKKQIKLGYYDSPKEAHFAYLRAAKKYWGEFATRECAKLSPTP